MAPTQPKPPTATSAASSATPSHLPTSKKPDPPMANLSISHPRSRFQPSNPKVESFTSFESVEKLGKKAKETSTVKPHKFSKEKSHCLAPKNKGIEELLQEHAYLSWRLSVSLPSRSGRRTSIGGSQIELADLFANNGVKVVAADMPPFMQIHAVDSARKVYDSMEKFTSKSLALSLKKEFDGVYGSAWHCIVGRSFGSFVTHSVGGFLYFSMAQKLYILLFKTTVQRAN